MIDDGVQRRSVGTVHESIKKRGTVVLVLLLPDAVSEIVDKFVPAVFNRFVRVTLGLIR